MIVLFFGSSTCEKCDGLYNLIKKKEIDKKATLFKYIDAFDDNQQEFCDEHEVDELPHLKVYKNSKLIYNGYGIKPMLDIEKIVKLM